jgi:F-type H+-transporting ATPase subunit delta
MASGRLVLQRYARALLELASGVDAVDAVTADLTALAETIAAHDDLAAYLASPRLTRQRKRALLTALLGSGTHDLVRRTVLLMVDKGRAGQVPELALVYGEVAREAAGRVVARVESAVPLDDGMRRRLIEQLGALSGKTVTLDEQVVPELMGGLRIVLGSQMFDGSLQRRLEAVRDRLLRAPLGAGAP